MVWPDRLRGEHLHQISALFVRLGGLCRGHDPRRDQCPVTVAGRDHVGVTRWRDDELRAGSDHRLCRLLVNHRSRADGRLVADRRLESADRPRRVGVVCGHLDHLDPAGEQRLRDGDRVTLVDTTQHCDDAALPDRLERLLTHVRVNRWRRYEPVGVPGETHSSVSCTVGRAVYTFIRLPRRT